MDLIKRQAMILKNGQHGAANAAANCDVGILYRSVNCNSFTWLKYIYTHEFLANYAIKRKH